MLWNYVPEQKARAKYEMGDREAASVEISGNHKPINAVDEVNHTFSPYAHYIDQW